MPTSCCRCSASGCIRPEWAEWGSRRSPRSREDRGLRVFGEARATERVRVVCIVIPAGCRFSVAPPLQLGPSMKDFETLDHEQLLSANGGLAMDPAARWIMQHE